MLLTVSIGNTNISYALFDDGKMRRHDRLPLGDLPLLAGRIGSPPLHRIALASVAPERTEQVISLLSGNYGAGVLVAGRDLPYGIEILCDAPDQVGADRLLNAVAAHARTRTATIVADIGTAITVDVVSPRGAFCGGAIAPGPALMLRALHEHTELLPHVTYEKPPSPIGRNTTDAIRSGVHYGTVALVESLISRMAEEIAPGARVILTGGAAEPVAQEMKQAFELLPALTHEGLAILAARA